MKLKTAIRDAQAHNEHLTTDINYICVSPDLLIWGYVDKPVNIGEDWFTASKTFKPSLCLGKYTGAKCWESTLRPVACTAYETPNIFRWYIFAVIFNFMGE